MKRKIEESVKNNQTESLVSEYLSLCEQFINDDNLNDALIVIELAIHIEPDNDRALYNHARILYLLNRPNDALKPINACLRITPDNPSSLRLYTQICLGLNRFNEEQNAMDKNSNTVSNNFISLQIAANRCYQDDFFDEALIYIERALRIRSKNALSWESYARILTKLNRLNEAHVAIDQALSLLPNNNVILHTHADIFLQLNRPDDALVKIQKALTIEPKNDFHLLLYANILHHLDKPKDALVEIKKAIHIAGKPIYWIAYAQILTTLNELDEAQGVISHALSLAPNDKSALHAREAILNKLQRNQAIKKTIDNTPIATKYINSSYSKQATSHDNTPHKIRNHLPTKLCTFQKIKDVKQGSSLQELQPIPLKINKSNFTYYTKEPSQPSNDTPCIFIMAGRQGNAAIPTSLPVPNRIILVITEDELNRLYLSHENENSPAILLPERTDLLVINHLESPTYGGYDQTALINARRVATLCVAFHFKLNYLMLMDDNIEELNCTNGTLRDFNQLWEMHQPDQLLSSIVTSSNRSFNSGNKNKLGSKLFLMNAVQLQQAFDFIKPEELAFFLFLPPHCSNLVMEDYYFQLLITCGLYLNNSLLKGHVAFDEQTISLTRSSANKSAAKKSTNAFGAYAWLSLNIRTFITDSIAKKVSNDINPKPFITPLINDVVNNIQTIVTNNLQMRNEYLSECRKETLNKVKTGSKTNNQSRNKEQLWELIKNAPDLNLRQPQKKAIELWINEKNSGYLNSYSIATGVGKTYIKAIMAYLELACTDQPVIVVTADQKLVNNLTDKFISIFKQLNNVTQLNLSSNMIIPVMSSGNKAINQGALAVSDGFKITQNLYVFCEDSFLKLIQEGKVDVNHTSLILLDEYHCYTKTLDAAIKAVEGFAVYIGQMDKGTGCYCLDVYQDCISLFDAQGTKRLLDLKPSLIFNSTQIKLMKDRVTNKNPVQLSEQTLLNILQATLRQEQQKMPFPTFNPNNTIEIPFYWGNELPATTIKLVDQLPTEIPNERTTYITPTGIYQTNQTGITQCVITQDELIEHCRESINAPLEQDKNQLTRSMREYFAANITNDDFRHQLNQLIMNYDGLPCMDLEEWTQTASPECFILTNTPPQLIYKNQYGKEQEIASGFDLYQIWGFEQMKERKSYFERIDYHPGLDLNKIAALKQLCANKQLATFPSIIKESGTNMIGFSATPPKQNPLTCVFTYSKETAEKDGYITPSIVRLMEIKDFDKIPYERIFKDVLTMNSPEVGLLGERKGLYRFKSINELKKAEQILKDTYKDLSISAVHTPKGKERSNEEEILKNFSTIPYNQGAILLIVSKLQKGWDEPRLSYTVDFKKNPSINSAIQFLGRATRVCSDINEQQQPIAKNKIGLGFFPNTATNVKKHLEPLQKPLPQNKTISLFYNSGKKGCIEDGDYNLNSMQKTQG